jgi:hypothetical protein
MRYQGQSAAVLACEGADVRQLVARCGLASNEAALILAMCTPAA